MTSQTSARVLAHSEGPDGDRLVTLEVTFPRFILAEFNTHRAFSRNSASSRAVPVKKQLERVTAHPYVPGAFPVNRPGMSATEYVTPDDVVGYRDRYAAWILARDHAVDAAHALLGLNVHKQIASRLLEPFMWHTVIVSATEWDNFFSLRISEHAQPEIREAAEAMLAAIHASCATPLGHGEWHLPLIDDDDRDALDLNCLIQASVARVAAVSYDRHLEKDYDKEWARYGSLAENRHLSPFEHAATPSSDSYEWANFQGWRQARWHVERGEPVRPD